MKDVILTPEGYKQLTSELDMLRTTRRREVAERIAAAREFGEIAENAEYDDAKNEQMMLEHRIAQLEERLANAQLIDKKRVDTSVVSVGAVVRLRDVDAKQTVEYFIVGSAEANPAEQKLSNESPVGKAIMGRRRAKRVEEQRCDPHPRATSSDERARHADHEAPGSRERIAAAREFGEIAENAEYDDAKNEQMMLEHRIAQLEERLANAQLIDKKRVDTSVVSVGAVVRLRDVDAKQTVEYFIVGSAEANPAEQKLSNESPVGKAIMGRKKGETVEVVTPRGSKVKFKIMEIKAA